MLTLNCLVLRSSIPPLILHATRLLTTDISTYYLASPAPSLISPPPSLLPRACRCFCQAFLAQFRQGNSGSLSDVARQPGHDEYNNSLSNHIHLTPQAMQGPLVYGGGRGDVPARERERVRNAADAEGKGGRGSQKQVVVNPAPLMLSRDPSPGSLHHAPCTMHLDYPKLNLVHSTFFLTRASAPFP